jgi:hypothetical protein
MDKDFNVRPEIVTTTRKQRNPFKVLVETTNLGI